jgi:NAD-dependent dihydropyrimidine dehydrogenase PreA subunit
MIKNTIHIDEDKCNGCGRCVPSCHEGAIAIVDGKARLTQSLCDGLGACLGECPQGAITITADDPAPMACGCPGTMARDFRTVAGSSAAAPAGGAVASELRQWPVQLKLLNPGASYFQDADIVVSADCAAFSYGDFHRKFLKGKALVIFCPKLDDDLDGYAAKLTDIFRRNTVRSVTVVRMEVPCCGGVVSIVEDAVRRSGKNVIIKEYTIGLQGDIV